MISQALHYGDLGKNLRKVIGLDSRELRVEGFFNPFPRKLALELELPAFPSSLAL